MSGREAKPKPTGKAKDRKRAGQDVALASLVPVDVQDQLKRLPALEAENARLREQLVWSQRGNPTERTGGTLSIFRSDDHVGDRAHLLNCHAALVQKSLVIINQYQPDKVKLIFGGDFVAGRGIYKEQHMDSVSSDVNEQVAVAAHYVSRYAEDIAKELCWDLSDPECGKTIEIHIHKGNHDYALNHEIISLLHALLSMHFFHTPVVRVINEGVRSVLNLADKGVYNVLVTHGTGHSQLSPSSPTFWNGIKDIIIMLQQQLSPKESIHRVLHGHTHWFNIGMERIPGLSVDVSGGLQRNERVRLNMTSRPVGWVAYVSPKGYDSILQPIPIQPDLETLEFEFQDPNLAYRNMQAFAEIMGQINTTRLGKSLYKWLRDGRW